MSGKDGSCCLGTYTCVANNCMGSVTSSAALLGFEDTEHLEMEQRAIAPDLQTPDISDVNNKPFSLSTIQEERTSQMMSPDAANTEHTLRQHSLDQDEDSQKSLEVCHDMSSGLVLNAFIILCFQKSIVSAIGKVDQEGELSLSIGNQEVTLSLYQTPDLSERDAEKVCEMFAEEIAESISENNKYVELPPLRFTKETAKASNINMEAIVIDIDRQDLEEYESMKRELENIDDLKTECDIEDVSVADWNEPVKGTEFEAFVCEEIMEIKDEMFEASAEILHDKKINPEQALDNEPASHLQETDTIKRAPKKVQIDGTINNLTPQTVPNMETQMPTGDEREEGVKSSKDLVGELSSNLNTVAKIQDIKSHEVETSTVLGEALAVENHEGITVEKVHLGEQKAEMVNVENSAHIEDFESRIKTLDPSSEGRGDVKIETKQITENIIETDSSGVAEVNATVEEIDSAKEQTQP